MSARVRPAVPADLPGVLDLWEALIETGHGADARFAPAPGARAAMADWMRQAWFTDRPFVQTWVAEDQGLVGFVNGFPVVELGVLQRPAAVRISDLYVAPTHRRAGLGAALVRALTDAAARVRHPRVEVGTLVRDARAVAFWRSQGFVEMTVLLQREPLAR